jgi:hypothetical protein
MKFYTIPTDKVSIDTLRSLEGKHGSRLNPIQDVDGEWIVSMEEWDSPEFAAIKEQNKEIAAAFGTKDTTPRVFYLPEDPINQ